MAETIFEMLESEHDDMRGLLEQAKQNPAAFSEFSSLWAKHVQAEEIVLYGDLKQQTRARAIVLEGFEEHRALD